MSETYRYLFNRRHWEGLFGTGGWVEEPEPEIGPQFVVPVNEGTRVIVGRNEGTFFDFRGCVHRDHEWTELRVIEEARE